MGKLCLHEEEEENFLSERVRTRQPVRREPTRGLCRYKLYPPGGLHRQLHLLLSHLPACTLPSDQFFLRRKRNGENIIILSSALRITALACFRLSGTNRLEMGSRKGNGL